MLPPASAPSPTPLYDKAQALSAALPAVLVEAEHIAASVLQGVHGRKRAGTGESFWQYRPYAFGDATTRIDWRKSARSPQVYIRENEWEAVNTLWLWANPAETMNFQSNLASTTKRHRAYLLALALASMVMKAHERVGLAGSGLRPSHMRQALLPMATWLVQNHAAQPLMTQGMQRQSSMVLFSDFLEPIGHIETQVKALAAQGISGHLVQINDPAEESLPYAGRIEFLTMTGNDRFIAGKTQKLRSDYQNIFTAHRTSLRQLATRLGWSFTVHHTDQPPARLLLSLHQHLRERA